MEALKPVIPKPTYERQQNQIKKRVDDIFEEITVNENLISKLKKHAEHMKCSIRGCSSDSFPSIFSEAYSSLSKYSQMLIEINCKLEDLMMKEIRQWNASCLLQKSNIKAFEWEINQRKVTPNETQKMNSVATTPVPKTTKKTAKSKSVQSAKLSSSKTSNTPESTQSSKDKQKKTRTTKPSPNSTGETVGTKKKNNSKISKRNVVEGRKIKPTGVSIKQKQECDKKKQETNQKEKQVIGNVKLSINSKYEGFITFMVSPLEFYTCFMVQNVKQNFITFKKEMETFYKNFKLSPSKPKGKTIKARKQTISQLLGDYALLHAESAYLRVKIKNWYMSRKSDIVTVDLIDTGGTKNVSLYNLHPLPKNLMKFPAFATRCHLAKVPKDAGHMQNIIDYFRSKINKTTALSIEICDRNSSGIANSLPVVIYDSSNNSCINEMVICKIHNDPTKEGKLLENWDPMSEAYKSSMNMYNFNVNDPAASIYGYVGKDFDRVCKLYGNSGKCFKKACKKEHVLLDPKGFTTDKEDVYVDALNSLNIPRAKSFNVCVTHVESPSSFYCVLDAAEIDTKEETLFSLHSYMNEKRNIADMKKMLIPPAVGQIVLAQFPKDNSWYRARVMSVLPEKDECDVFYVDHGSTATVNFSCIRAIEPKYLHLPFQAIFCEICGVGDDPETSHLAVQYLNDNLLDVSRVEIVSSLPGGQPHLLVKLYTSKGENVAEKLLANKLVARKENILLDETKTYLPG